MANQPSTTDLVQLQDIREGLIILKDNSLRAIVEVSAINFDLRGSEEQAAIIQQFQAFLNSFDFPIQIVIHSRKFDITTYLATLATATETLTNELMKIQAQEYGRFVKELSELSNIMSKRFYIALPFHLIIEGEKKGFMSGITGIFKGLKNKNSKLKISPIGPTSEQLAGYRAQLQQRAELVSASLSGMGLKGHMLEQDALTTLFTELYNPVVPPKQEKTA